MKLEVALSLVNKHLSTDWNINGTIVNLSKSGWGFNGFDKSTRRLGVCILKSKTASNVIGLSKTMTELRTEKEVEQTILHEIAHAIEYHLYKSSSHGLRWKAISRIIGYEGERTTAVSSEVKVSSYKFLAYCETHGILGGWTRKPKNDKICRKCHEKVLILSADDTRVKNLLK